MSRRLLVQLVWAGVAALALQACSGGAPMPPPLAVVEPVPLGGLAPDTLTLPNSENSVKFAVIGDSGRGNQAQRDVAAQMARFHERFAFPFVIMVGDNLYEGAATPDDYRAKFEEPYAPLLAEGVQFFASLGNHDDRQEINYEHFNMRGRRYYRFAPPGNLVARLTTPVAFFALDSTYLDSDQLAWLDAELKESPADWKVVFLHHPIYTSGRYRASAFLNRSTLESIFRRRHVSVVFSGHEHIYQRTTLQNGIQYFITGGAGSLRPGDGTPAAYIARTYSANYHFMLIEIEGETLHFQAISRTGATVDAGRLHREPTRDSTLTRADTAAPH
ncbi:MAG TPA: metallophosphoesterase [Vicinamibacterales bacterium]|jgi:3',5'-cyclic AMP phosphodiesterase CpdA|nr:metallophosphoesterase [Vicinamibacterales bacterium]